MKLIYIRLLFILYVPAIILMALIVRNEVDWLKLTLFAFFLIIYGIAWDIWSTKHGRSDKLWIWRFNKKTITGFLIKHHPLEEYLFGVGHIFWLILFWELLYPAVINRQFPILLVLILISVWEIVIGRYFYNYEIS